MERATVTLEFNCEHIHPAVPLEMHIQGRGDDNLKFLREECGVCLALKVRNDSNRVRIELSLVEADVCDKHERLTRATEFVDDLMRTVQAERLEEYLAPQAGGGDGCPKASPSSQWTRRRQPPTDRKQVSAPAEPFAYEAPELKVLVVRHGDRPYGPHDPELTEKGHKQAEALAKMWSGFPGVIGIYASPFIRALQTAAPLARELGGKIRVDWQLCEVLSTGWVKADPWPHLLYSRTPQHLGIGSSRRQVSRELLDSTYEPSGPRPDYPEFTKTGQTPGARNACLERHRSVLESIKLAHAGGPGGTIVIFGHGGTHNFLTEAVCPGAQGHWWKSLDCVNHCAVTTLLLGKDGRWRLESFGQAYPAVLMDRPRCWIG